MNIDQLLLSTVQKQASDLHLVVGKPPVVRIVGELHPLAQLQPLTVQTTEQIVFSLLTSEQKERFIKDKELDFSYALKTENSIERFRVNTYFQQGSPAASLRHIPGTIRSFDDLALPTTLRNFKDLNQGFVLVTGPTGHGKSTTLATLLNEINTTRPCHIITIEDPIEFTYTQAKALISQRELQHDTYSFNAALRAVLREDPDVVLVGEMRDQETIASALTVAETGHLVLSTLHTNSAAQTINRIIDVFPEHQQNQIRQQLASTLSAVVCQRLVPTIKGSRVPALEILISTAAVRTSIRESKIHLIDNIIQTSKEAGMVKLEEYLAKLVMAGTISLEVAEQYAFAPSELRRYIKK